MTGNELSSSSGQPVRKKPQAVGVTPPQGGGRQESLEEETTEDESPIMFQHREIWSKKLELRFMPLRIGSRARDTTDDPIPATMDREPMVDRASEQVAVVTQAAVSTPDSMVAP
ncbi:hypothetical protein R1flu_008697 [Riccia fluitans]|uniref:Uncharacterized protein n=1 Tax=Riccia fluitans TaxID=41844 RepID=A0ABD1YG07_9MARC